MSKYHDHRSDCPFKFAPLDVCDCVEHNMLDHIKQLVATNKALTTENKRLSQQCEGLMRAGMNNGQALILAEAKLATCEKYRDAYAECDSIGTQAVRDLEAKLAKAVAFLDDLWDSGDYFAGELNDLRKELKGDDHD